MARSMVLGLGRRDIQKAKHSDLQALCKAHQRAGSLVAVTAWYLCRALPELWGYFFKKSSQVAQSKPAAQENCRSVLKASGLFGTMSRSEDPYYNFVELISYFGMLKKHLREDKQYSLGGKDEKEMGGEGKEEATPSVCRNDKYIQLYPSKSIHPSTHPPIHSLVLLYISPHRKENKKSKPDASSFESSLLHFHAYSKNMQKVLCGLTR